MSFVSLPTLIQEILNIFRLISPRIYLTENKIIFPDVHAVYNIFTNEL